VKSPTVASDTTEPFSYPQSAVVDEIVSVVSARNWRAQARMSVRSRNARGNSLCLMSDGFAIERYGV
jgi:hypothetical protein